MDYIKILIIAWRNVWRNKLRSLVVILSILIGIWSGVFILGLSVGLNNQRTDNAISTSISHIQIHNANFLKDNNIHFHIENPKDLSLELKTNPSVIAVCNRTKMKAMLASSAGGQGVSVTGIDPEFEKSVTTIDRMLTAGNYFTNKRKNQILIGQKLALKLKAKISSKLVMTLQNKEGDIIAGAFKVCGIFKTSNSNFDQANIYVKSFDLLRLIGEQEMVHEIAILQNDIKAVTPLKEKLAKNFKDLSIQTWDELAPELGFANEMMSRMLYIFIGIILLALGFGILNTMLMAVLERRRELGMLMAVGMNKSKVFTMIMIETVFLTMCGGPLGIVLGYITIEYFSINGIDLSVVAQGLESIGVGRIVYTNLEGPFYFQVGIMIVVAAILSSIYPAIKALSLKPAEAVRAF